MATAQAQESKMFRLRVGDKVSWDDTSEHPPIQYEGDVVGFDNEECTYLNVELYNVTDEDKKNKIEKTLTEDEVRRIG